MILIIKDANITFILFTLDKKVYFYFFVKIEKNKFINLLNSKNVIEVCNEQDIIRISYYYCYFFILLYSFQY